MTEGTHSKSDKRLLVAEDNPAIIELLEEMLDILDYSGAVVFVTNGLDAVNAFKTKPYDIILMDCQMPEMDGYEATLCIRAFEEEHHRQPAAIIAMTGNLSHGNRERCREIGMNDFLSKPFTIPALQSVLNSCLNIFKGELSMAKQTKAIKKDSSVSAIQSDAIDWSVLDVLKVLQKPGKPDIRKRLIDAYLSSSPTLFESAAAAVIALDGEALMRSAHSLKSSCFAIGAMVFGATCFELEKLGRANTLEEASALLNRAENEYNAVCFALRASLE